MPPPTCLNNLLGRWRTGSISICDVIHASPREIMQRRADARWHRDTILYPWDNAAIVYAELLCHYSSDPDITDEEYQYLELLAHLATHYPTRTHVE